VSSQRNCSAQLQLGPEREPSVAVGRDVLRRTYSRARRPGADALAGMLPPGGQGDPDMAVDYFSPAGQAWVVMDTALRRTSQRGVGVSSRTNCGVGRLHVGDDGAAGGWTGNRHGVRRRARCGSLTELVAMPRAEPAGRASATGEKDGSAVGEAVLQAAIEPCARA